MIDRPTLISEINPDTVEKFYGLPELRRLLRLQSTTPYALLTCSTVPCRRRGGRRHKGQFASPLNEVSVDGLRPAVEPRDKDPVPHPLDAGLHHQRSGRAGEQRPPSQALHLLPLHLPLVEPDDAHRRAAAPHEHGPELALVGLEQVAGVAAVAAGGTEPSGLVETREPRGLPRAGGRRALPAFRRRPAGRASHGGGRGSSPATP